METVTTVAGVPSVGLTWTMRGAHAGAMTKQQAAAATAQALSLQVLLIIIF
jgi:hypothetical protein